MSFSTGTPQRRGAQAGSVGLSLTQSTQIPLPLRHISGPLKPTSKKRKVVSIGDDDSIGLVIHGKHGFDNFEGTDPDGATPPVSGYTLQNPDFPVSYNGRGTLKFISPIRITTVDGPLNVNGEVYSNSGLLAPAVVNTPVQAWASTIEIGATGAGAEFTLGTSYATYFQFEDNITLHVHAVWTDKGSVGNGDTIFIKGLPFTNEAQIVTSVAASTNITPTEIGSSFIVRGSVSSTELQLFSFSSNTGLETTVTGAEVGSTGTISFTMNYHAVVP